MKPERAVSAASEAHDYPIFWAIDLGLLSVPLGYHQPSEYPYYRRVLETRDDYFDYYRDYHAFWKLYGLDLPDEVLKDIYFRNALRITPGIPRDMWPGEAIR